MSTRHKKTAVKLIARPGGGKGTTEAALKSRGIEYKELAFRAKFDREIERDTVLGREILRYKNAGLLVPNDIILPLVDEALEEVHSSNLIILDGFPRNTEQVSFAIERLRHFGVEKIIALYIDTPLATCMRRLAKRGRDKHDKDLENAARRFQEFDEHTLPMINSMRLNAETLGIKYFMIDGENLLTNMDDYLRMLGIDWMVEK